MTPQILPTETKEVLIAGQYTKSEWLQLSDIERREISYNRYLQNVVNAPKVNYDSLILSALYEIIYYISNGLFEAFSVVKGDVTANVIFDVNNEPVITLKTPNLSLKISDSSDGFFTKKNIKVYEKLVGAKTAKLLKAELPTETVSTTNEVFEIGKSSCKKLSAIQTKTYSNPKDYLSTFSNTSYPYWTVKYANDDTVYFAPVNAIDFKINLKYFNGFEFFAIESKRKKRSYITVYEKSTGFKVVESWICFLDSELTKRSQCNVEFSGLIKSAINNLPFTIEPNESIESINQKRIAQNEIYVFGTTSKVEPIAETQPETAFSEISGLEKSFAKNYINAELKTRNIESLINEFETALLTCKESDKKSYYYALNELKNLTETQPETNEENEIKSEPETNQEPTNQDETMQPQPTQPQTLEELPLTTKELSVLTWTESANSAKTDGKTIYFYCDGLLMYGLEMSVEEAQISIGAMNEIESNKIQEWQLQIINDVFSKCYGLRDMFLSLKRDFVIELSQKTGFKVQFLIDNIDAIENYNPQPQTLTVGQKIQGENCYLIVTAVKEAKKAETQEPIKKTMIPTQRIYTEFWTGEHFTMYQDNYSKESCLIGKNGRIVKCFIISNTASYRFWDKSEITMKDGQFFELNTLNPITHIKYSNGQRFVKMRK